MILLLFTLCLASTLAKKHLQHLPLDENALSQANKLLRKEQAALLKALSEITQETEVGAEPCDSYCDDWSKFKKKKEDEDHKTQAEICDMYKSKRCSTCEDVQAYCGWKKVTEEEQYSYTVSPGGKCMTLNGKDPKYLYEGGKGHECESICDGMPDCFGYSISIYNNCLLWLQRDIMGGGEEWGGADCHMKDLQCSGNVGQTNNCYECFNGYNGKYLWGNTCHAKEFGKNAYQKGVCGQDYTCYTNGEKIGECPYGEYCPAEKFEVALGAEACDSYCETWSDFRDSKKEDNTPEEICGMYKSTRCSTCEDVQYYCGWKKVTESEHYSYSVSAGGKCRTLDGKDPKYLYEGGKGHECEELCDSKRDCFGYSISGYNNCLLWLQRDIMGGGEDWGGADCHIKDLQCSGNVGDDYNCFECYNGYNNKYLWGNTCYAKEFGKDTYKKGVCGNDYKCFTGGEDIGKCPYEQHCPSV